MLVAPLFCSLVGGLAYAEVVVDLYTASLEVPDRGQRTLRNARRNGLAQVLVKVSGSDTLLEDEQLNKALGDAERFLRSYSYESADDGGLSLRLSYDELAVQSLLRDAGLPLWTANRPTVLTWLVLNDGGRRRFAGAADPPVAEEALRASFGLRGVPLQTPLLDLEDTARLSPGEAWRQSSTALLEASQRYRDTELLAGRVARMSDGRWTGDWKMLYEGRWINRSVSGVTLAQFTDAGAALAAETLAKRYAVTLLDAVDRRHRVTLRGIRSYGDYQAAQSALASLEAVRRVVPERLLGDQVSLRVEADADLVQLARIIELDSRFVPSGEPGGDEGLFYEWIQ